MYYALSLQTELSSPEQIYFVVDLAKLKLNNKSFILKNFSDVV